jgi:SRSO17 transposase
LGKVEQSQVGVYLSYAKDEVWTLLDGALFLPEKWFSKSYVARRAKAEIPAERSNFQTKIELGWQMLEQAQAAGLPFVAVAFDSLYGRSFWLREPCDAAGIEYYADIPANQLLYLERPVLEFEVSKRGKVSKKFQVVGQSAVQASALAQRTATAWQTLTLRTTERGILSGDFARYPVWTVNTEGIIRQETLLMKRETSKIRYSLTNAPSDTDLLTLAQRKCQRYFVERSIQDAKSELGMDEFQAIKYRAWQHHLALTILASWFIAETRLDWQEAHRRDPHLAQERHQCHRHPFPVQPRLRECNGTPAWTSAWDYSAFAQRQLFHRECPQSLSRGQHQPLSPRSPNGGGTSCPIRS